MPVKKKSFIVHTAIYLSVDAMQRIGMNGFAKRKTNSPDVFPVKFVTKVFLKVMA
jgi:hypothetical protein